MSRVILGDASADDISYANAAGGRFAAGGETSIEFRELKGSCELFGWLLFKSL